jgi:hypothetical protein
MSCPFHGLFLAEGGQGTPVDPRGDHFDGLADRAAFYGQKEFSWYFKWLYYV